MKEYLVELSDDGSRKLYELWKQIPEGVVKQEGKLMPLGRVRRIVLRLSENWGGYTMYNRREGVPWTNNGAERMIGITQMRDGPVRGYKSKGGMVSGLMLGGSMLNR